MHITSTEDKNSETFAKAHKKLRSAMMSTASTSKDQDSADEPVLAQDEMQSCTEEDLPEFQKHQYEIPIISLVIYIRIYQMQIV